MVYSLRAHKCKRVLADPPPELDVLLMAVCLEALLSLEIEKLQCPALRLERDDRLSQVHNGTIRTDRSPNNIVRVFQINYDSLRRGVRFVIDLAHAYVLVGFECLASLSVRRLSTKVLLG